MTSVNVYLTFNGNCEEAFTFYKLVFGGDFNFIGRFKDMPPSDGKTLSASDGEKIMHVSLPISKETSLMGSDATEEFGGKVTAGTNFSISVSTDSKTNADKFFKALSAGGNETMPMSDTFWGSYFGMLVDKFGINWMVSFDEKPSLAESNDKKQATVA